jgi:hypothetical protein
MATPLDDFLARQAELLTGDIDKKITPTSPWLSQVPKGSWPDEIGHVIRNVMWERTFPETENAWEDIVNVDSGGLTQATCLPTPDEVVFKQTIRDTNLATKAVISPKFCIDDLKSKWKRKQQMGLVVRGLSQVTKDYNIRRNRNAYFAACGRKVVLDVSMSETGEGSLIVTPPAGNQYVVGDALFADATPISIVTHGVLDHFHSYLDREGAGEYASAQDGGGFIYKLITSAEHSQWLRKEDAAVRVDFRESSMSDILLKGLGITHTFNGYAHIIDPLPRRFERNADAAYDGANGWEEIMPWVKDENVGSITEDAWIQNPLYGVASFEDCAIYLPSVLECLVPIPVDSVGQAKYRAQNYQGDFRWLNIAHEQDNPLENTGKFYGRITNGFQTHHPEMGIVIRHQRAPLELDLQNVNP